MIRAGLVLAAGHSRRFGADNKLLAPFRERPLAAHAAEALRATDLDVRIAVVSPGPVARLFDGFEVLSLPDADAEQSDSLRVGVRRAVEIGADRLLITLADMPLVSADLLAQVLALCGDEIPSCVRADNSGPMPPACFPAASFPALLGLVGDRGAGALLKSLPDTSMLTMPDQMLSDVDTLSDLTRLSQSDPEP